VRSGELVAGKLLPYLALTLLEFCGIALLMRTAFAVPINGSFLTLLALQVPFTLTTLGVGLLISTRAATRDAAMQLTLATVLPSIFLSGYFFPLESMPAVFRCIARAFPTTWMIDASRGVVVRGAGWADLKTHALVLCGMALGILWFSAAQFRKRVG